MFRAFACGETRGRPVRALSEGGWELPDVAPTPPELRASTATVTTACPRSSRTARLPLNARFMDCESTMRSGGVAASSCARRRPEGPRPRPPSQPAPGGDRRARARGRLPSRRPAAPFPARAREPLDRTNRAAIARNSHAETRFSAKIVDKERRKVAPSGRYPFRTTEQAPTRRPAIRTRVDPRLAPRARRPPPTSRAAEESWPRNPLPPPR